GVPPRWPEIALISKFPLLMAYLLCLLDVHQKTLELWRVSVRVDHRGRKQVGRCALVFRTPIVNAAIAPVDGNADLEGFLAGNHHLLDAFGHHRLAVISTSGAADLDLVASLDSLLRRQLLRYFHKRLRNQLHVHGVVLGPVVVMLGYAVSGAGVREFIRSTVL